MMPVVPPMALGLQLLPALTLLLTAVPTAAITMATTLHIDGDTPWAIPSADPQTGGLGSALHLALRDVRRDWCDLSPVPPLCSPRPVSFPVKHAGTGTPPSVCPPSSSAPCSLSHHSDPAGRATHQRPPGTRCRPPTPRAPTSSSASSRRCRSSSRRTRWDFSGKRSGSGWRATSACK